MIKRLLAILATLAIMCTSALALEDAQEYVAKSTTIENPQLELSNITAVTDINAYMFIYSGISVADTKRVFNDIMWLKDNRPDLKDIQLFINSPGGDAFQGLALASMIKHFQDSMGFTFHAFANGIIASAALPVFAVCKDRVAASSTIFMVHEAALFKWPGRETASDIRSQNELMILLADKYIAIMVASTNLSTEKWKELEKKTTWFGVTKAESWGLISNGK
jgi:ATP-dependent protease ClpP protease subunit